MPSPAQQKSLESRIAAYETTLAGEKGAGVRSYLDRRGLTAETITRFRLGANPENGRLTIPFLNPAGAWSVKQRCVDHDDCKPIHPDKYINDPGAGVHLYNAQTLLTAERVVLVEGELDAITVEQIGFPAVAYPGVNNWQKWFRWTFDSVDEVVVVGDGDEPGRKAANSVTESLRSAISGDVRAVILPDGEDTNSFVLKYGAEAYLMEMGWLDYDD